MSIETDDVYLNHLDTVNMNECIYCSVSPYSTASRGCTDLQVSQCDYITCQNCSSKFCTSCIHELIQSVEGFENIPMKVKQADKTYRQLMDIQTQDCLGNTFLGEKIDWYASLSLSVVDGYFFLSRICSQEDQTISLPQCFTVLSLASDARRKWH